MNVLRVLLICFIISYLYTSIYHLMLSSHLSYDIMLYVLKKLVFNVLLYRVVLLRCKPLDIIDYYIT